MMFRTHLAFGFLIGLFAIQLIHPINQILFLSLVLFGSLFPDIDHPNSKIGRHFKPINFLFEHRGFFHSFLFLPLLSLIIYYIIKTNIYTLPILVGYSSHLISDALTKEGVMPLHPLSKFRVKGVIKTGHLFEHFFFLSLLVFDAIKLIKLY